MKPHIRKSHIRRIGDKKIFVKSSIIHKKEFIRTFLKQPVKQQKKFFIYFSLFDLKNRLNIKHIENLIEEVNNRDYLKKSLSVSS